MTRTYSKQVTKRTKPTAKISYYNSVDYSIADPSKILAQKLGKATAKNMPFNFKEIANSRGESAYVFDMGSMHGAIVQEGLGTKSLIAQSVYRSSGKSFFKEIAQDTVAAIINDLISVGATPVVVSAYWSSSSYKWLSDNELSEDFIRGWKRACDLSNAVWGGGETQSLPGVVSDGALELAGSAFGVIKPKSQFVDYRKLKAGDKILLLESNGVHANGISLVRQIASKLSLGYTTKLADGKTLGETLLAPTHLYASVIRMFFDQGLDIHYLSNITGHGWRKIMRAKTPFTYFMEVVPPAPEIFNFIVEQSGNNQSDMYSNFNMGAGYAVFLPEIDAIKAQKIAEQLGFKSWLAGTVKKGPKQVIIKPLNINYGGKSLGVRS